MSKRVLIVGCGQLGCRHAQALAVLDVCQEVVVVDPDPQSLALGRARVQEVPNPNTRIRWQWEESLPHAEGTFDLAIVATQAAGRVALIKEVATKAKVRLFLIEKIVAQSIADYEDLLAFSRQEDLKIWVNCKSRAYQIHKYIKSQILLDEPITFEVTGGNHGLANNGVHMADLFIYYDQSSYIDPLVSSNFKVHPTKRGGNILDLSGILLGKTDKGSQFSLSYSADNMDSECIRIASSRAHFKVEQYERRAWESRPENSWTWQPLVWREDILVSHMTKTFVLEILSRQRCDLPNLEQCYPAHEFILKQLQPAFQELWNSAANFCPVT